MIPLRTDIFFTTMDNIHDMLIRSEAFTFAALIAALPEHSKHPEVLRTVINCLQNARIINEVTDGVYIINK